MATKMKLHKLIVTVSRHGAYKGPRCMMGAQVNDAETVAKSYFDGARHMIPWAKVTCKNCLRYKSERFGPLPPGVRIY